MKRRIAIIFALLSLLTAAACGNETENKESSSTAHNTGTPYTDSSTKGETELITKSESESFKEEEDIMKTNRIYIKVGKNSLTAVLEDNEAAIALQELLTDGALTISASNYGGFEKVCPLGMELPRNDSRITTHSGDICLYNGNQIVIFYDSNSWSYTRLGRVSDVSAQDLEDILSGEETEITLSLDLLTDRER